MMTDDERLEDLLAQRRRAEERLAEIRPALADINAQIRDLAPKVAARKRLQEWRDAEPERAAVRATPEWQAWREQLFAERKKS